MAFLCALAPLHGHSECVAGEAPIPLPYPQALTPLPLTDPNWPEIVAESTRDRLDEVAGKFLDRAPAWSLAVWGPQVGFWEHHPKRQAGARFAAASIGKSMTAVLIFQEVEAGRLRLDQTIDQWFPDLPQASKVTIDHLLSHRSGYVVPANGPLSGPYRPPEENFEALAELGSTFCPGQGWMYSNVAYQLLGRILEAVSQREYGDLLTERIIKPLSLNNTHILRPNQPDPAMVMGHQAGKAIDPLDYATPFAAAPVSSSAADLLRYWHGLLSGALVNDDALKRMSQPAFAMFDNAQMGYGAGMQVANVPGPGAMLMHSGGISGFSATVAWLPEHQLMVAVMANERQVPAEAALWALVQGLTTDAAATNSNP